MIGIEREYIHFFQRNGELIEKRFKSSMQWPKNGRLYALASDPEAIERCKREALKTPEERAAERAAAEAHHERYRIKQVDTPLLYVEEPAPQAAPPVRRFAPPPVRRKPIMPAPRR